MMRENARERNSRAHGLKSGFHDFDRGDGDRRSGGSRSDYRENLFSVFIDSINPMTEVDCLWGVFKVFGRVRDIFLSAKISSRRSRYAFIRFGTREEASKVAKSVHGMHVYGWPINASLAEHDWNNRRSASRQGVKKRPVEHYSRGRVGRPPSEVSQNLSFVKAVKGKNVELRGERKGNQLSMSWKKHKQPLEWLDRCAIEPLKDFSSVSSVNQRLIDKEAFFMKVGRQFGDPLWVDKETLSRGVFVHGEVVTDPLPVEFAWLNHFLDLGSLSSEGGASELSKNEQYTSEFDFQNSRLVGEGCRRGQLPHTVNKATSNLLADKGRRGDDCSCPKSVYFSNRGLGGTVVVVDKGKKQWIRKPRHKAYPCPTQNDKLVIGKNQVKGRVLVEDSSSSSTESERSWGAFLDVNRKQGECSNKSVPGGPTQVGPAIESSVIAPQGNVLGQVHKNISGISIVLGGDNLSAGQASQPNREPIKENLIQVESSLGEHSSFSCGEGNKTVSMESGNQSSRGSGKSSDSTSHDLEGNESQLPPKTPKRRGRKKGPATKSHAIKTRFASRTSEA
ncbi:hypothetical protein Q3G72_004976 [Acer saccharum]|nr:hypothetical protein Q3G72_004976 [Acer saccharum]